MVSSYRSNCHCVKLDLTSGKRFWLGLRKSKSNGNWSWDDGSEYSYKNWDIGEPNSCCPMDPIPIHSYVGGNGLWYDTGELHYPLPDGYVCKYKRKFLYFCFRRLKLPKSFFFWLKSLQQLHLKTQAIFFFC